MSLIEFIMNYALRLEITMCRFKLFCVPVISKVVLVLDLFDHQYWETCIYVRSYVHQIYVHSCSGRTNTGYNRLTEMASVTGFGFPQTDNRKFKCAVLMLTCATLIYQYTKHKSNRNINIIILTYDKIVNTQNIWIIKELLPL